MGCVGGGKHMGGAGHNTTSTSNNLNASTPNYTIIILVWFGKPGLFTRGNLDMREFRFDPYFYYYCTIVLLYLYYYCTCHFVPYTWWTVLYICIHTYFYDQENLEVTYHRIG